jgi:hypothetical protein
LTGKSRFAIGPLPKAGPNGQVAEWLKAADCKSARVSVRWFESSPVHHPLIRKHPRMTVEIPENLGYSALLGPHLSAAVCMQPEASVGGMWE